MQWRSLPMSQLTTTAALAILLLAGVEKNEPTDADVVAGIRLVNQGDYLTAIGALDRAVQRLRGQPAREKELAQAYVFLGIAYMGEGYDTLAKAAFRDAVAKDRNLALALSEHSPRVLDMFALAREDVLRDPAAQPPPATAPVRPMSTPAMPPPGPAPPPLLEQFRALERVQPPDAATLGALVEGFRHWSWEAMAPMDAAVYPMGAERLPDEKPIHSVSLDPYRMDEREVTNWEYRVCVRAGACPAAQELAGSSEDELPVVGVSWHDADAYCRWVGKRLPTEAEWEHAAAARGSSYPWGNELTRRKANFGNNVGKPTRAGTYEANANGLFDMIGNVMEWCQDWYAPDYYRRSKLASNPSGPPEGTDKVKRGGSWAHFHTDLRAQARHKSAPSDRTPDTGFRCAARATGGPRPPV